MGATIRVATPNDARAIAEIHIAAWRAAYRGIVGDEALAGMSVSEREQRWTEILIGNESRTVVAERDGAIAGYCAIFRPSRDQGAAPQTAEIAALYVAPDRWRSGIGSALLEHVLAELQAEERWADITLWVFAANDRARAFYEHHGFTSAGEPVDEHTGEPIVRLRRRLRRA
jgi:ribosomal protein S18 acetylase RimI-like enzyme